MDILAKKGCRVIYYSMAPFEKMIRANGCEYRAYPSIQEAPDLSDGKRLLKLYRLLLEYTGRMLPVLLKEIEEENPCCVLFDSLALWGRAAGVLSRIPAFSFYSIVAVRRIGDRPFFAYAAGFAADFWRDIGEIPKALSCRCALRRKYGLKNLGLLPVLMNKGDRNFMGYSRYFQPGGARFGKEYLFLGPMSARRRVTESNDFCCPRGKLIYVSFGTIFNRNGQFTDALIRQLGADNGAAEYQVMLVYDGEDRAFPDNFIVRPFINQMEVMRRADLFISAGGMNSIHEALLCGVPCLMYPQQGEQLVNARQFERLGFGRILRDVGELKREIAYTIELNNRWNEKLRKRMTAVHIEKALSLCGGWEPYDGRM